MSSKEDSLDMKIHIGGIDYTYKFDKKGCNLKIKLNSLDELKHLKSSLVFGTSDSNIRIRELELEGHDILNHIKFKISGASVSQNRKKFILHYNSYKYGDDLL